MLQLQTNLQHFYKLLMWPIFIDIYKRISLFQLDFYVIQKYPY